jgi:mannose-1-phosphate guanylyltransferase
MLNNTFILIMAGGLGSRFWPKSRESFPKQFLDILGTGETLIQSTVRRFEGICEPGNFFVLTNESYLEIVKQQIPSLPEENIILEPSRNNTAPCIAYACYKILAKDPNANIVISPSDQLILKEEAFKANINKAIDFASFNDALITLGITPTRPDTGYGYIKYKKENGDVKKVERFLEKPPLEKAQEYLFCGDYLWNAGIFIWNAQSIIKALNVYSPEIANTFSSGMEYYGKKEEKEFIQNNYPKTPNISIDYAVMEKAENVYTIPSDLGWSDLGTWSSLYENMSKDETNSAKNTNRVLLNNTKDCLVHLPENKVAVIKGLENYIVVDDGEILLIIPKSDEQHIKQLNAEVVEKFGNQYS